MASARAEGASELVGFTQDALGFLAREAAIGLGFKLDESAVGSVHPEQQQVKIKLRAVRGAGHHVLRSLAQPGSFQLFPHLLAVFERAVWTETGGAGSEAAAHLPSQTGKFHGRCQGQCVRAYRRQEELLHLSSGLSSGS